MVWINFLAATAVLVLAAVYLARYGDAIGVRTGLGGLFVGTLLLSAATSLPELLTGINSLSQGAPDLLAGNLFGSNMANMALLAVLDLFFWRERVLRQVALRHGLTASIAILATAVATFFILSGTEVQVGWVGIESLVLVAVYVVGSWVIQDANTPAETVAPTEEELTGVPSLRHAIVGFAVAAGALVLISPRVVDSALAIAEVTGLSTGFVGALLVALATSLPELVATVAAARIGAYDMAVGNLFGSNIFNMAAFGIVDCFHTGGAVLGRISPAFVPIGLLAIILMGVAVVGNLSRPEPRRPLIHGDAALILILYVLAIHYLYVQGVAIG